MKTKRILPGYAVYDNTLDGLRLFAAARSVSDYHALKLMQIEGLPVEF